MKTASNVKLKIIEMDEIVSTPSLLATARRLTLSPSSGMNNALDYYRELYKQRSVDALGIFAYHQQKAVGWALFTFEDDRFDFTAKDGHICSHIFVDPDYRRIGIGSKLMNKVAQMATPDTINVYAWSNRGFFYPLMEQHTHFEELKEFPDHQQF